MAALNSTLRAAIYARVSTKDKGQEVENQLRQLREFSSFQGWAIYREFVDHETGSSHDRIAFQTMFKDASQRKFDVLLFWALDRLSREGALLWVRSKDVSGCIKRQNSENRYLIDSSTSVRAKNSRIKPGVLVRWPD